METLRIELTVQQVQRMLNILGTASYQEVADIIDVIKKQANTQIEKKMTL